MTAPKFAIKKHVTLPLLKLNDSGVPIYAFFTGAIFKAKVNEVEAKKYVKDLAVWEASDKTEPAPTVPNPPELAHVIDMETGEVAQIIVNAILKTELVDTYPNGTYVGKGFEIKKFKPTGGKRYAMIQIAEVEVPAAISALYKPEEVKDEHAGGSPAEAPAKKK
jgi:hypothetical protein